MADNRCAAADRVCGGGVTAQIECTECGRTIAKTQINHWAATRRAIPAGIGSLSCGSVTDASGANRRKGDEQVQVVPVLRFSRLMSPGNRIPMFASCGVRDGPCLRGPSIPRRKRQDGADHDERRAGGGGRRRTHARAHRTPCQLSLGAAGAFATRSGRAPRFPCSTMHRNGQQPSTGTRSTRPHTKSTTATPSRARSLPRMRASGSACR